MSESERLIETAVKELMQNPVATIGKKAGHQIEKYLSVFRPLLVESDGKTPFMDVNRGFDWCGAFVWYCCHEADIDINPDPFPGNPTLALVRTWYDYCVNLHFGKWITPDEKPENGDIIIYRNLSKQNSEFNHIGIIEKVESGYIVTIEGNMPFKDTMGEERSCIKRMQRDINDKIKGYVRLS